MLTRLEQEQAEQNQLASYAVHSTDSRGRCHEEEEHQYRSRFQRDRDRIVHATAFRRMEYKTQVFVNHEGDHFRTRLTHTMEVAQISRTIARALRLNEDLVEAMALGHDLGHTPFGHTGEKVLDELLRAHGQEQGFEHNIHGLRVVDCLEKQYQDFDGLNLSYEVREGFVLHRTTHDSPDKDTGLFGGEFQHAPSLEVQVVSVADAIAYNNHDLDDGLESGLLKMSELADLQLWRKAAEALDVCSGVRLKGKMRRAGIVRYLINLEVSDILENTRRRISELKLDSLEAVRAASAPVVCLSQELLPLQKEAEKFLMANLYRHWRVQRMSHKARLFITSLFDAFVQDPSLLLPKDRERSRRDGVPQAAADYVAGMTDRYAQQLYMQLNYPFERT